MNCKQLLDILMSRLGSRTQLALRANCLTELILVQQNVLERDSHLPWFLQTTNTALVTPSDGVARSVALPADFLREADDGALFIIDSEGASHEVVKDDYRILEQEHGLDATSELPLQYALRTALEFFPIPLVERSLRLTYYAKAAIPTDSESSENAWLQYASDLMLAETGIVVATQHLQNPELGDSFAKLAIRARTRLFHDSVAREEAARARSAGDD
jgi:hypothetical protein